jgi:hypothetical protein
VPSIKEFSNTAFDTFEVERSQDLSKIVKHIEFSGKLVKGMRDGKGGYNCPQTKCYYYGGWV